MQIMAEYLKTLLFSTSVDGKDASFLQIVSVYLKPHLFWTSLDGKNASFFQIIVLVSFC